MASGLISMYVQIIPSSQRVAGAFFLVIDGPAKMVKPKFFVSMKNYLRCNKYLEIAGGCKYAGKY